MSIGTPHHKDVMRTPFVKRHIAVTDHAILDSSGRIITIAKYPLDLSSSKSNVIIPLPDHGRKPKIGWWWNTRTKSFQETDPNVE